MRGNTEVESATLEIPTLGSCRSDGSRVEMGDQQLSPRLSNLLAPGAGQSMLETRRMKQRAEARCDDDDDEDDAGIRREAMIMMMMMMSSAVNNGSTGS